jgi:UDP-2,4-diacetamido-2,4,6-trideoxy-beta-L-altropyranose hydrolase
MRIGIRADAGPLIGVGHVMRCLTLANALASDGAEVTFVAAVMPEPLANRIVEAGHKLERIPVSPELERRGADWHDPPLSNEAQLQDARATRITTGSTDWMIVDHYLLDAGWHSHARGFAAKLLVIDDLANRPCDCDLLVDQTLGRSPSDYSALVPVGSRILAGARFALLRPDFAQERRAALVRRNEAQPVRRILISMGATDPNGIAATVLDITLGAAPDCRVDIVVDAEAPGLGRIEATADRRPNVAVHVDCHDMARLMSEADLAIGAAGTTSWERCCLGLPSIALILAENQRAGAEALDAAGALVTVDSAYAIGAALEKLIDDPDQRSRMSAAAFAIVDGRGTDRVVSSMLGKQSSHSSQIELRKASMEDAETLWLWRNDPATRMQSRNSEPVGWADHLQWLSFTLADPMRHLFIADRDGLPVAVIRFDPAEGGANEVSITVAPDERGTGTGTAVLRAGCEQAGSQQIVATVSECNWASRRLFESSGFKPVASVESGFLRYALPMQQRRRKLA